MTGPVSKLEAASRKMINANMSAHAGQKLTTSNDLISLRTPAT